MKKLTKGINPENKQQARVFFHLETCQDEGFIGHPQHEIKKLIPESANVIGCIPQSLYDGWDFWIDFSGELLVHDVLFDFQWKPINQP
jgi:hypothetical protein